MFAKGSENGEDGVSVLETNSESNERLRGTEILLSSIYICITRVACACNRAPSILMHYELFLG